MAYSDFTLSSIKKDFHLSLVEQVDLFQSSPPLLPSSRLTETLQENIPLALGSNTEKARSELLIVPILLELRRQFSQKLSVFSGVSFTVDSSQGLNGNCDFLITYSTELLLITAPIITLVEAKKEDLNGGLGQCIAEMIAAQRFNAAEGTPIEIIYGTVTSGTVWKFLCLEDDRVFIDLTEYYLRDIDKILGILAGGIHRMTQLIDLELPNRS